MAVAEQRDQAGDGVNGLAQIARERLVRPHGIGDVGRPVELPEHGQRPLEGQHVGVVEDGAGVLVSDFYGAYTTDPGLHPYCWAHLLRDVHDLTGTSPADARVQGGAAQVQATFARAHAAVTRDAAPRARVACQVRAELEQCCAPWLPTAATPPDPPVAPVHRRLCQRITRHLPALLTFLTEADVPATNNAAERSLRPLVISRKISGGTRSEAGSDTKLTLASLFGTWRVQGINPFTACQTLLATPSAE